MKKYESQVVREWGKFVQAFWLDLPKAAFGRLLGDKNEAAVNEAGWNAYDAFVGLANEATNLLYANPMIGAVTGQGIERALQAQRVTGAAASAFFGNLWPALGLPTADEVASLRSEVAALHADLSEAVAVSAEARPAAAVSSPSAGERLSLIRNGYAKRGEREERENAAA